MSTIEEAAVSHLITDAGVAAITTKHHPLVMPQNAVLPLTVYQVISGPPDFIDHVNPRIQVACWAVSYSAAVALGNAVRAAMHMQHATVSGLHFQSMVVNEMDGNPDLDAGHFCRIVDVKFFYQKPLT